MLRQEQRAVAVAEEAEVVGECPVVDAVPVVTDEGGDEQQERAVGLVEVRHHTADDTVAVAGGDDDTRGEDEGVLSLRIEIAEERVEGLLCRQLFVRTFFVGEPLLYV